VWKILTGKDLFLGDSEEKTLNLNEIAHLEIFKFGDLTSDI